MEYRLEEHRYALKIIKNDDKYNKIFENLCETLSSLSDNEIIELFEKRKKEGKKDKSISDCLNSLISEKLTSMNWKKESPIFKDGEFNKNSSDFRLDFVYPDIFSLEVSFNHNSATVINLLKPVLASELNHVEKAYQTKFGIIITATKELKEKGGFDSAIGTFEGYCNHLKVLMNQLTIPIVIIGLKAPKTFEIMHEQEGNRKIGYIKKINSYNC